MNVKRTSLKLTAIAVFSTLLLALSACSSSPTINKVKNGTLATCPSKTLEQMTTGFIENIRWSSTQKNERSLVSVSGKVMYEQKKTPIVLEFLMSEDESTFAFDGIQLNNERLGTFVGVGVLMNMCRSRT